MAPVSKCCFDKKIANAGCVPPSVEKLHDIGALFSRAAFTSYSRILWYLLKVTKLGWRKPAREVARFLSGGLSVDLI
jgi:hypothetical protein